jgi:hypothetical protein
MRLPFGRRPSRPRAKLEALQATAGSLLRGLRRQILTKIKTATVDYSEPARTWIVVKSRHGPGWLRYDINRRVNAAKRTGSLPHWTVRSALAAPSKKTLSFMGACFAGAVLLSLLLSQLSWSVKGTIPHGDRIAVYTTMWQVQAAIAALALPVLIFVVERARDEQLAALHSAEVLGRESLSFLLIGLSFIVLARMGIDLTWFADEQAVFLTDVLLLCLTLAAAIWAYFSVLRLLFSPSRLKDRSVALAKEKVREVILHSVKVRIGNNVLFSRLAESNIKFWPLGWSDSDATQYLVLDAPEPGFFVDIHVSGFAQFVSRLPWRTGPQARTSVEPARPTQADEGSPDPVVWLLRRFGDRLTEGNLGLVRLDRSLLAKSDKRSLEAQLRNLIRIQASDDF